MGSGTYTYEHELHHRLYADSSLKSGGQWSAPSNGHADMSLDPRTETIHTLANEKCDGCDQRVLLYDRPFADN